MHALLYHTPAIVALGIPSLASVAIILPIQLRNYFTNKFGIGKNL